MIVILTTVCIVSLNVDLPLCSMSLMTSDTIKPVILSVVMLNVVMLNVVAPQRELSMLQRLQEIKNEL